MKTEFSDNEWKFQVNAGVYEPREDSFLFSDSLYEYPLIVKYEFCEVGTGSGFITLALCRSKNQSKTLIVTDLSYDATVLASSNFTENGLENILTVCTNYNFCFRRNGLPEIVIFNPPYLPRDPQIDPSLSDTERLQFTGGFFGYESLKKFVDRSDAKTIFSMISSNSIDLEKFAHKLPNWDLAVLDSKKLYFEVIWLIMLTRKIA